MEEGGQVKTNPNPKISREEGDVYSSDNDEIRTVSVTPASASASNLEEAGLVKTLGDSNAGRSLHKDSTRSYGELPTSASSLPNRRRSTRKSRGPFVPFVISFSDDESDSESEELIQSKPLEIKSSALGVKENNKPPISLVPKLQLSQQKTRNVFNTNPNRVSLSRTFTSSMVNINRQTSRNSGSSVIDKKYLSGNFRTSNTKSVSQEEGGFQNLKLDTSKVQDLRQQIETMEKELKRKSVRLSKDNVSGSHHSNNVSDSEIDVPNKGRMVSAEFTGLEVKEPERKRIKLNEPHDAQRISDNHQHMPPLEQAIQSGKDAGDDLDERGYGDHRHQERRTPPPVAVQSEAALLEKQEGIINDDSYHLDKVVYPSNSSEQTEEVANTSAKILSKKPVSSKSLPGLHKNAELNYPDSHSNQIAKEAMCARNLADDSKLHEVSFCEKALEPMENHRDQGWGIGGQKGHLETPSAYLSDARLYNYMDTMSISQDTNVNIETLFDLEEMQDKELEEAQEHRRRCEMEERNALRAYRKAQRALIEANARCSHLYQKRELCSVHVRSLMIENSRLSQPSGLQTGINSLKYVIDNDVQDPPRLSCQMMEAHDEQDHLSNIRVADGSVQIEQEQHAAGKHVISDPCCEPDDSTPSGLKDKMVVVRACTPSTSLSASTDEDDETSASASDEKSIDSNHRCRESTMVTPNEPERGSSRDTSQDSLLLEATLRSQLFARLGTKALSKNRGPTHNLEPAFEPRAEHSGDEGQAEANIGNVSLSLTRRRPISATGGIDGAAKLSSQFPGQYNGGHVENFSSYGASPAADSLDKCYLPDRKLTSEEKVSEQDSIAGLNNRNEDLKTSEIIGEDCDVALTLTQPNNLRLESVDDTPVEKSPINILSQKVGSYTSNDAIDPFWPLCVFELRGKCNNDECPWQHIKDQPCRIINLENSEDLDFQVEVPKEEGTFCTVEHSSRSLGSRRLVPPTYHVSLDMMKANSQPHALLVTSARQYWQKCFSNSLVLSCMLTSDLPTDEPFLHGSDARIEVHGNRNNQSLYFHRNILSNNPDQHITDTDQILEVALQNIYQEVNNRMGKMEALNVLARSLEANSSSVVLWVAYLHIYHSIDRVVGDDDMFSLAVELNQGSYELWLIYINTRMQLEDRLTAYNNAILAICRHASTADGNALHTSACILDLFLQYLNFFCSSGNICGATEKIYKLFTPGKNSECNEVLLLNILPCLTLYDKCIFWFCCIYFTVYKKLPDAIVQCFECQKEFNDIEWPHVDLTSEEKQRTVLLMEMAVDSLALYLDCGQRQSESGFNAAHMFAINHVKCMAVLDSLECCRKLLDNYTKIYPSCLELVLLSAEMDLNFVGFEDAIRNWEVDVPGVQCLWNKYAKFALKKGKSDFAKQLMVRWFHSVWLVKYSQSDLPLDSDTWLNSSAIDDVFGLFNLSLYKTFDKDPAEARSAIDMALKVASPENYKHCVKEHVFLRSLGGGRELLNILKFYIADPRAISTIQPLSRKVINGIKKPRVLNLVSNIWKDISSDFSLVNLVLEAFYGPSLLPISYGKLEDLVDLVEGLMEIAPSNYPLALSVGKLLNSDFKLADVAYSGVSFWATSLITNSVFQAVPIPPEFIWIEAANTLRNLTDNQFVIESFNKKALTAYPFSLKLWKSYLDFSHVTQSTSSVIALAKERGILLD